MAEMARRPYLSDLNHLGPRLDIYLLVSFNILYEHIRLRLLSFAYLHNLPFSLVPFSIFGQLKRVYVC